MKDYGKPSTNESSSPEKSPPAKKRRVDTQSVDPVEAKLNEIRSNMKSEDQSPTSGNGQTSSKKKKNKNKNKNKIENKAAEQSPAQSQQEDFDYSHVDFKKFGGGSIVEQKNEIKTKFQGKVSLCTQITLLFHKNNIRKIFFFQGKNNKANKRFMNMLSKNTKAKK